MNDLPEQPEEEEKEEEALGVEVANSGRLFTLGCCAVVAVVLLAWWRSPLTDPLEVALGVGIIVLGCLPSLLWARNGHPWFPCFEISTLTSVVFYGIPLLTQHDDLKVYSYSVIQSAGFLVVIYLGCAIAGFNAVRIPRTAPHWATTKLLSDEVQRYLPAGLLLNTLFIYVDRFTAIIPYEFLGPVRALCFGLGTITAFILACEWGRDRLSPNIKIFFVVCLLIQVIILFSQLYLITGISLLILSAIGYTTTRRKVPWLAVLICLPIIAVLHNGKSKMRENYWVPVKQLPALADFPAFFSEWVEVGLQKNERDDSPDLAGKLVERASLFQMLCMSVDQVPDRHPHLEGESYFDIPAQVIPRFLWPDKPSSLLSNIRLAVYFELIDPDNAFATSIAFGMISEAYINFGFFGVIMLGALTGMGFKHIVLRSIGTPLFSGIGIFMILLTAWSFQAEQVMATWLSSLFQACAISIGVPVIWKQLFGSD